MNAVSWGSFVFEGETWSFRRFPHNKVVIALDTEEWLMMPFDKAVEIQRRATEYYWAHVGVREEE